MTVHHICCRRKRFPVAPILSQSPTSVVHPAEQVDKVEKNSKNQWTTAANEKLFLQNFLISISTYWITCEWNKSFYDGERRRNVRKDGKVERKILASMENWIFFPSLLNFLAWLFHAPHLNMNAHCISVCKIEKKVITCAEWVSEDGKIIKNKAEREAKK